MILFFKLLIFSWLYIGSECSINCLKLIILKACFDQIESYQMFYSEFAPKFDMHISYGSQRRHCSLVS